MNLSRRSLLQRGAQFALSGGLLSAGLARAAEPGAATPTPPAPATKPAPDPYADAVFVNGAPPMPDEGSFTVVVLPDTQNYTGPKPGRDFQFHAQTEWVVAHKKDRRIAAVLHLGDVTNHNTPEQWKVAREAMYKLDGHVPYFMVPGNHDYSTMGKSIDRTTGFTDNFPLKKFRGLPTFGGVYDREPDRTENSFHTFDANGREFVVICLEWGPRADVVRWANEVVSKHAHREAILITHAYMYFDETRYDFKKYGKKQLWNPHAYGFAAATNDDVCDGQELWDKLVSRHENFILTMNGHVLNDGLGRTVTATPGGRDVNQVLVNFQMKPNGGDGWLRLLEFKADGKTIDVRDYSPVLDRQNESKQNRFTMGTTAAAKSAKV
jgi:hypothetical protein